MGYSAHGSIMDSMDESDKIIQVIPVSVPTFALFETENITSHGMVIAEERNVNYLALTACGDIKPLILTGECHEFADSFDGYLGMYESSDPNAEK